MLAAGTTLGAEVTPLSLCFANTGRRECFSNMCLRAICWLACLPGVAFGQSMVPTDPTQPTPLQQLGPGLNGGGYYFTAPTAPEAVSRPDNWAGGNGPAGQSQSLDPYQRFEPTEAERYSRELAEQAQRASRLGGPPQPATSTYSPLMQQVLGAPYELANAKYRASLVPGSDYEAATRGAPQFEGRTVAYEEPVPSAGGTPAQPPLTAVQPANVPPPYAAPPAAPMVGPPPMPAPFAAPAPPPAQAMAAAPVAGSRVISLDDPSMVIARVEQDVILLSDVLMLVNEVLAKNADKIPKEQYAETKRMLVEQAIRPVIESKMIIAQLKRKLPAEAVTKVTEKLGDHWESEEYRKKLREARVTSRRELEAEYRRFGTTLEREKKQWIETELARQWMGQQIKFDQEVTHEQMLERYRQDIATYQISAGARWEEIKLSYTKESRAEAWAKLAAAGNQILQGAPFADVAKQVSQGTTATEGGARDWVSKGSLAAKVVDEALFSLPLGQLSPIIDDGSALQILRVLERREAGVVPFTEAQAEIKKKIQNERIKDQTKTYVNELYGKTKIWTIFEGNGGAATSMARTAGRPAG